MTNQPVLVIENLSLTIDGNKLFSNFNLSVNDGEKVLIRGKSGTGKSTLLNLLLGFILPDRGSIILNGSKMTTVNLWEMRLNYAFVGQSPDVGQGSAKSIFKHTFSYRNNKNLIYDENEIKKLCDSLDLAPEVLEKDFIKLSGGEKQRLAIIHAKLLKRKIYLLDEITSALDKSMKNTVADLFMKRVPETVITISHDPCWLSVQPDQVINLDEVI